jgi:hypothetical protein
LSAVSPKPSVVAGGPVGEACLSNWCNCLYLEDLTWFPVKTSCCDFAHWPLPFQEDFV